MPVAKRIIAALYWISSKLALWRSSGPKSAPDLSSPSRIRTPSEPLKQVIDLTRDDDGDSEGGDGDHTEVSWLRTIRTAQYRVRLIPSFLIDRIQVADQFRLPLTALSAKVTYTHSRRLHNVAYSGHARWEETPLKMCVELFFLCYRSSADCVPSYFRISDLRHGDCRRYLHLRRYFTQNIDCIETKLPSLSPDEKSGKGSFAATWQLHGRIDQMICQCCKQYLPFNPQLFHRYKMPLCFHARSRYRNIPREFT
jgi:hypothetical protein